VSKSKSEKSEKSEKNILNQFKSDWQGEINQEKSEKIRTNQKKSV
jgi:hypothetical protein